MPPDWTPNLDASDLEHHHPTHTPIGSSQELKAWKPEIQQGLLYAPLNITCGLPLLWSPGSCFCYPKKGTFIANPQGGPYSLQMELWHWKYPDKSVTGMIQPMPTNGAMSSPSHTLQNDPCFEWKWPSFGRFKAKNRGQTGSSGCRKIYIYIYTYIYIYIRIYIYMKKIWTSLCSDLNCIFLRSLFTFPPPTPLPSCRFSRFVSAGFPSQWKQGHLRYSTDFCVKEMHEDKLKCREIYHNMRYMCVCMYLNRYIYIYTWNDMGMIWEKKQASFILSRFNPNFEDCFCWGNLKLLSSIQHTNTWKMQVNVTWRSGSVGYKPNIPHL